MLAEEFLNPIGMSKYRLAKSIGVPAQRIGDIIAGKRGITADTDLRLCRFFGLSDGWWLRLQAGYDTVMAKRGMAGELERIVPLERAAWRTVQLTLNGCPSRNAVLPKASSSLAEVFHLVGFCLRKCCFYPLDSGLADTQL